MLNKKAMWFCAKQIKPFEAKQCGKNYFVKKYFLYLKAGATGQ